MYSIRIVCTAGAPGETVKQGSRFLGGFGYFNCNSNGKYPGVFLKFLNLITFLPPGVEQF